MAVIKKSEFKQMDEKQLKDKLADLKKEMMKLNAQRSTGTTLENPGRIRAVKKTIARIYTALSKPITKAPIKQEKTKEVKTK